MPMLHHEPATSQTVSDRPFRIVYQSPDADGWALAILPGENAELVGICWNRPGRVGRARFLKASDWFILPAEVAAPALSRARELQAARRETIAKGYEEQAADLDAEAEALEWCDALIGDAYVSDAEEG